MGIPAGQQFMDQGCGRGGRGEIKPGMGTRERGYKGRAKPRDPLTPAGADHSLPSLSLVLAAAPRHTPAALPCPALTVHDLTTAGPRHLASNPPSPCWGGAEAETWPHLSVGTSQAREGGRGPQAGEAWVWQGRAGLHAGLREAC